MRLGQRLTVDPAAVEVRQDCRHFRRSRIPNENLPKKKTLESSQYIEFAWLSLNSVTTPQIPTGGRFPATVPALQQHFGENCL
jgi:hypothetical protein